MSRMRFSVQLVVSCSLALACSATPRSSGPAAATSQAPTAPAAAQPPAVRPAPPPAQVKRILIARGRHAGTTVMTTAADGTIATVFDLLENGRGPHTEATVTLAHDGTIASLAVKGHHTFGAPVDATFTRSGDHARW